MGQEETGVPEPDPGAAPYPGQLAPGDEAAAGTEGTGEDICPQCGGRGHANGGECPACAGTGKVTKGIAGA
jgi:hypothetical protein